MSCAGLTRASIPFVRMDCRVKPGNDELFILPIDAFDPCDDVLGAQLGDNSAEMLQIIDLKIDGQLGEIRRAAAHADVVDIAVMLGYHGGDLRQAPGLVDIVDQDSCRKTLWRCLVDIPAHVEPALRL